MNKFNLEFRNENGEYLFDISGEFALTTFNKLKLCPEFVHTTRKIIGKQEFVVLDCIKQCGYKMGGTINFVLNKGGYIKCTMN